MLEDYYQEGREINYDALLKQDLEQNQNFFFTISGLTSEIKKTLVTSFSQVWVKGEVSQVNHSYSGHMFINLKDEHASLPAVIFKSKLEKVKFPIEVGQHLECYGSINVYEKRGNYQFVVDYLTLEGQGKLDLLFKELYEKLAGEGMFAEESKKSIPRYPEKIGVITSPNGAALKDFLKVVDLECPETEIYVFPVQVQGSESHYKIAEMLKKANDLKIKMDVLVLTRGGGSREDLWAFNEEDVVRAVHASKIPVISAIGHEVDYVLSDLASDYRASTPTAAAEKLTKYKKELIFKVGEIGSLLQDSIEQKKKSFNERVEKTSIKKIFNNLKVILSHSQQQHFFVKENLNRNINELLASKISNLNNHKKLLFSLSPQAVLDRGYHIVSHNKKIISDLDKLKPKDKILIENNKQSKKAEII